MQNEQVFCSIQGHQGHELSHICIYPNCHQLNRLMCQKCIKKQKHKHDESIEFIKIENSKEYFIESYNEQRLPQLQLRLKSQNENQVKCEYLQKIYANFNIIDEEIKNLSLDQDAIIVKIEQLRSIILKLIDSYQNEIVWAQSIQNIYQKFIFFGLQSLDKDELNKLLDCHRKFFNQEIKLHQKLIVKLDKFFTISQDYNQDLLQNSIEICIKLDKIKEYVDFQQSQEYYSEIFLNSSFFSQDDKYFALVSEDNHIKIRHQKSLNMIKQLVFKNFIRQIQFDTSFKYFVVLDLEGHFYYYIISKNKQFKMIKQLKFKLIKQFEFCDTIQEFFISDLSKIIVIYDNVYYKQTAIKTFNFKNVCINQIIINYGECSCYCYGREKRIIAIYSRNDCEILFYKDNEKIPFICVGNQDLNEIDEMIFINEDSELLTQNSKNITLWQINYQNQQFILKSEIAKGQQQGYLWQIINQTEFCIIICKPKGKIEILDKNLKSWLRFSYDGHHLGEMMYITKYFIIIFTICGWSQVIQRKIRNDYDKLKL